MGLPRSSAAIPPVARRSRPLYAVLILLTVAAGLASRSSLAAQLPAFVAIYAGDTLWALTLFLVLGFSFPRTGPGLLAIVALTLAFFVEFSQLYQARWINAVRDSRVGALVLGRGFLWSDLICYAAGVGAGWSSELMGEALSQSERS